MVETVSRNYLQYFTFQSGYIQICILSVSQYRKASLHSNLVIFKFNILFAQLGNFTVFTFQSGYIQMDYMAD